MKFDELLIGRGRSLKRLLESGDFSPFMAELDNRISDSQERLLGHPIGSRGKSAEQILEQYQTLRSFRDWINEEIDDAGQEILRKISQQSQKDLQDVKSPTR